MPSPTGQLLGICGLVIPGGGVLENYPRPWVLHLPTPGPPSSIWLINASLSKHN